MSQANARPYAPDIHGALIAIAARGELVFYSELENRRLVGVHLFRIAHEEDAAGRPPLTAIVVHKADGRPGPGFLVAMQEIGYARPGEPEDELWKRAVTEVHEYWRPKLGDDPDDWPRFRK